MGIAQSIVIARQRLSKAINRQETTERVISDLARSGIGRGNALFKRNLRNDTRAVHHRKLELHKHRFEFIDRLEILGKRLNRKNLCLDSLKKLCGKINFHHDLTLSWGRRNELREYFKDNKLRPYLSNQAFIEDLNIFVNKQTGIYIILHDYTGCEVAGLFEIGEVGHRNPFSIVRDYSGLNFEKSPSIRFLEEVINRSSVGLNVESFRTYLGRNKGDASCERTLSGQGWQVNPTPRNYIACISAVSKFVDVCDKLGKILPICPTFRKQFEGRWYGELEPVKTSDNRDPRDDLSDAISSGKSLQLVRLVYPDESEENLVIPEQAKPADYKAVSYKKFCNLPGTSQFGATIEKKTS